MRLFARGGRFVIRGFLYGAAGFDPYGKGFDARGLWDGAVRGEKTFFHSVCNTRTLLKTFVKLYNLCTQDL